MRLRGLVSFLSTSARVVRMRRYLLILLLPLSSLWAEGPSFHENFDSLTAEHFRVQSGNWAVRRSASGGGIYVGSTRGKDEALSVIDWELPRHYEVVLSPARLGELTGNKTNEDKREFAVVFDYQSPQQYRWAYFQMPAKTGPIRCAAGEWSNQQRLVFASSANCGTSLEPVRMVVRVVQDTVTILTGGAQRLRYRYPHPIDGANHGSIGLGVGGKLPMGFDEMVVRELD